jgi:hypothetical protein
VFVLTPWTYLILCAWVTATCIVALRTRKSGARPGLVRFVLGVQIAAVAYTAWGFVLMHHLERVHNDLTYESIGAFLACMSGLYAVVWCWRAIGLGPLMAFLGSGWMLMIFAAMITTA